MRNFEITMLASQPQVTLVIMDKDLGRHQVVKSRGLELAKIHAATAIKQYLAREQKPMPECDSCQGGLVEVGGDILECQEPACKEWFDMAFNIFDTVEVCIKCDDNVGVIEL